ncbi:MAG TPA: hypothetical protein VFL99_17970, partial [Segeticoccus sp.]|nr:hypothetical protein [Segeticoccus sp.]
GTERSESPKESELRWYWHEAGLPTPIANARIFDLHGNFVARVDILEPLSGYVGEFNGGYHAEGDQPLLDARRVGALEQLNFTVDVFTKEHLRQPGLDSLPQMMRRGHRRARRRDPRRDRWHSPEAETPRP